MDENDIRLAQGARLKLAREKAGYKSARDAALSNGWKYPTYGAHERGTRKMGEDDAARYARRFRNVTAQEILFGETTEDPPVNEPIPVMGFVGAGAEIEPEYEQVPPDGLHQIDPRMPLPDDMVAFEVRGDSMLPRYEEGDVIVCYREQRSAIANYMNREVAVRTADGRRYLKTLRPGYKMGLFNLDSWNGKPIHNVGIEWVGEVWTVFRAGQVNHTKPSKASRPSRTIRPAS